MIFDWFDRGLGVGEIRKKLIAEGREQKGWNCTPGAPHQWGVNIVRNILRCEDYTGRAVWRFNDGTELAIKIPQIIALAQFKRVQRKLDNGRRLSKRNTRGVYLLQNLIHCGECGTKMTAAKPQRFYYRKRNGQTIRREYKTPQPHRYQCSNGARYRQEENHAQPYNFDGRAVDYEVWRFVVDTMIRSPELIFEQIYAKQQQLQAQGDNLDSDINRTRARLAEIDQERLAYTRQLGRGRIDESAYDLLIAECDEKETDQQEKLSYLLAWRDESDRVNESIGFAERFITGLEKRLSEIDQPPEILNQLPEAKRRAILAERQQAIRALCDKVVIYADGRIEIDGLIDVSQHFADVNPENTDHG